MSQKIYANDVERKRAWYERQKKIHHCITCGKEKSLNGIHCQSCEAKIRAEREGMPQVLKTRTQNFCLDCGKAIAFEAKRCRSCGAKERSKTTPPPSQLGRKYKK